MIDAAATMEESREKNGTEFYINTNKSDTSSGISSLSENIDARRHTSVFGVVE